MISQSIIYRCPLVSLVFQEAYELSFKKTDEAIYASILFIQYLTKKPQLISTMMTYDYSTNLIVLHTRRLPSSTKYKA